MNLETYLNPFILLFLTCLFFHNDVNSQENNDEPDCKIYVRRNQLVELGDGDPKGAHWIIYGDPVSEKTEANQIIWQKSTENIKHSVSSADPHGKYLKGYRYSTSYRYTASDIFPNFIENENAVVVERNVTFTCMNDKERLVHFRFNLTDVNDPPEFLEWPTNAIQINLARLPADKIINPDQPIVIIEKDFDPDNQKVEVSSDRPELFKVRLSEGIKHGVGKKFDVKLHLNYIEGGDKPKLGQYILFIYAFDGQFAAKQSITLNIIDSI